MTLGIEVGSIGVMLEVFSTKILILDLDAARRGSVEEGETMTLASFLDGTYHQWETLTGHVPGRDDSNLGVRIFLT